MAAGSRLDDRFRLVLCVFAALLLLLRLVLLLAALDPEEDRVLSILDAGGLAWDGGPDRPLYDREELYTGAAAELMRLGPPLPAQVYRFMPYGGGSLSVAWIARAIFAAVGPTYLAFKALPLLVTLLGGLCWCAAARRWLAGRGAAVFALLYLLAPTVLVRTALIAKGDHAEAMAWNGLTAWLATEAAFASSARRMRGFAALAGLALGAGVALTYSTVPVAAAVVLAGLWRARARPRAVWVAAAAGLAVGLLPWLWSLAETGAGVTRVYNRPLGSLAPLAEIGRRLFLLGRTGLLASYDLPGAARTAMGWLWLIAWGAAWIRHRPWPGRAPFRTLLACGTAAHLAAFVFAAPDASSRYLVPAYPLFLLAVAAAAVPAGAAERRPTGRVRPVGSVLAAAVLVPGLLAQVLVIFRSDFPGARAPLRGYDWPLLGEVLGTKLTPDGVRVLPASVRPFVWTGVGRRIARQDPASWNAEAQAAGDESEWIWEGIGLGLMESGRWSLAPPALRSLPDGQRAAFRRGLWRYGELVFVPRLLEREPRELVSIVESMDEPDRGECRRALARTFAVLSVQGAPVPPATAGAAIDLLRGEEVAEAAGWALCRRADGRGIRWWERPSARPARAWLEDALEMSRDRARSADEGSQGRTSGRRSVTSSGEVRPPRSVVAAEPAAFWSGVAAAWRARLEARPPGSILDAADSLAGEPAFLAAMVADSLRPIFHAAARAARDAARRDPSFAASSGFGQEPSRKAGTVEER